MIRNLLNSLFAIIFLMNSLPSNAYTSDDFIWDFEWLESNNKVEIVVGEPYQLQYTSRTNTSKVFTSEYSGNWVHYDFSPYQHVVDTPTGYSIDDKGVITGLVAGTYAIKCTGLIQAKSGTNEWLYITVINEKSEETESNNTLNTANEFTKKIKLSLYNISDVDYVKYKHNVSNRTYLKFKVHYNGSGSYPLGFKWATFSGSSPQLMGGGSLLFQDQECDCLVYGQYVYFELYYDPSFSNYFSYNESFTIEVVGDETGIENIEIDDVNELKGARKYISNGKLFIEKNGKKYDIEGRLCK